MINFKNMSEKQALIYTVAGAFVLILIPLVGLMFLQHESGRGIFAGLIDNPENLTSKLEALQKEKDSILAVINQEKKLIEKLDNLTRSYSRYSKALPEADNLEEIYKLIDDVLKGTKLKVREFKPFLYEFKKKPKPAAPAPAANPNAPAAPAPAASAPPKEFPVNYLETKWDLEGDYQEILSFLHKVEDVDFARFVMITDLRLTPKTDPTNENNLEYMACEVTFVSFYYVKETPAKGGAK